MENLSYLFWILMDFLLYVFDGEYILDPDPSVLVMQT